MAEVFLSANFNADVLELSYIVERTVSSDDITLTLYDESFGRHKELSRLSYRNIGKEISSPFLNWYNVFFCSRGYGAATDYGYMHSAVQQGTKTAATVYLEPDSEEGRKLMNTLPNDCGAIPYGDSMIYVYHKGILADYFNLNEIKNIYFSHGCHLINWDIIEEYFSLPLETFGDETRCGFSLQSGGYKEQSIITGLLLGYPVESTICFLGNVLR